MTIFIQIFKYSNIKETLRRGLYFKTIFKTSKYRIENICKTHAKKASSIYISIK